MAIEYAYVYATDRREDGMNFGVTAMTRGAWVSHPVAFFAAWDDAIGFTEAFSAREKCKVHFGANLLREDA